jgi:hypothetical protein
LSLLFSVIIHLISSQSPAWISRKNRDSSDYEPSASESFTEWRFAELDVTGPASNFLRIQKRRRDADHLIIELSTSAIEVRTGAMYHTKDKQKGFGGPNRTRYALLICCNQAMHQALCMLHGSTTAWSHYCSITSEHVLSLMAATPRAHVGQWLILKPFATAKDFCVNVDRCYLQVQTESDKLRTLACPASSGRCECFDLRDKSSDGGTIFLA